MRKLARDGMTRNAIAKTVHLSPSTVSRICAEAKPPILFDRAATKVAVEARSIDLKARRAEIAVGMLDDLTKLREMMFTPITRTAMDRSGRVVQWQQAPDAGELRNLFIASGIAIDKHLVLVRTDSDDRDLPAVDQWLDAMMRGGAA